MLIVIPEAVRTSLDILAVNRAITGRREGPVEEKITRVIALFQEVGTRWTLIGAHAVGTFTEPRATVDFDFVVEESKLRKLLKALEHDLGDLDALDLGPAVRLQALDVDLIRSTTHPLFQEALNRTRAIGDWTVPVPEVLIVLKYLSAVNPWRSRTKKMYDVADLRNLYLTIGRDDLDTELMQTLSAKVYPGAETEFEALLQRIEDGEPISI